MTGPGRPGRGAGARACRWAARALLLGAMLGGCSLTPPVEAPKSPPPAASVRDLGCTQSLPGPLLKAALGGADRAQQLGVRESDLAHSDYERGGVLADPFVLPWLKHLRARPLEIGCAEGAAAQALDAHLLSRHPVSRSIAHAAWLLDRHAPASAAGPTANTDTDGSAVPGLAAALAELCRIPAATPSSAAVTPRGCDPLPADLDPALAEALAPIVAELAHGLRAQAAYHGRRALAPAPWWHANGGNHLHQQLGRPAPNLQDPVIREHLSQRLATIDLYAAAGRIARAVESAGLERFAGRPHPRIEITTPHGPILILGPGPDRLGEEWEPLLLLDLGGDDTYLAALGANTPATPVALAVDLAGNDFYGYPQALAEPEAPTLPADAAGRYAGPGLGDYSLSEHARQGAGRYGIGILFDLGNGDDRYHSLRMSQGYAHFGVGVLYDAGGNDRYRAEALSQGAAQFGIGILIDAGSGQDEWHAYWAAQGFGFVLGAGILLDGGGDDRYRCEPHAEPAGPGDQRGPAARLRYPSSQMRQQANTSFCQGAGFGRRGADLLDHLSGGIGVLRDVAGDDVYLAGVFAQGSGYWQATGILSDGAGADHYDAYYYAQGAGAHYAVGILADDGPGGDRFNTRLAPRAMQLGAGHDFSLGAFVNEAGDDVYHYGVLGAGAANCNGVGVFVDNGGADRYVASSDLSSGVGHLSEECRATRAGARTEGLMLDAGGRDRYRIPPGPARSPADGARWGQARSGLDSEGGFGLDGEGESGLHPGGR